MIKAEATDRRDVQSSLRHRYRGRQPSASRARSERTSGAHSSVGFGPRQGTSGSSLLASSRGGTGEVASSAGAEVIPRNDLTQIGKGYALGWAIDHVSANPPDFVVFIDADCRIQADGIGRLQAICGELQRPVQA